MTKFDVNANRMAALSSIQTGCPDFHRKQHQQHQVTILIEHGTVKMGQTGCGKTSVNICQNMLHNKPEVCRPTRQQKPEISKSPPRLFDS